MDVGETLKGGLDAGAHLGPVQSPVAAAEWRNRDRRDPERLDLLDEIDQSRIDVLDEVYEDSLAIGSADLSNPDGYAGVSSQILVELLTWYDTIEDVLWPRV